MSALTTKEIAAAIFLSVIAFFLVAIGLAYWDLGLAQFGPILAWPIFVGLGLLPILMGGLSAWGAISTVRQARRRYNPN